MADPSDRRKRHFILEGTAETERFRSPQQGGREEPVPERNRSQHGNALLSQIESLSSQITAAREVQTSAGQMKQSILTLNSIAELRRAKETAEFFGALPPDEQPAWLADLLNRTTVPKKGTAVPHVCIFDTGVNHGHPLITTALTTKDMHTVEPGWGTDDGDGHGTAMAGLAMAGNLTEALVSGDPIQIKHRLESVKLLPSSGANRGDARHHGYLTTEAVARPEVTAPQRSRLFSMAVTARDNRDRGRPSAWSATIDRLAADVDGYGETPRLFVISAGNVNDPNAWTEYPQSNETDGVHDPGQSWNALTIGAATNLVQITEPNTRGYQPVAPEGGLSPFSTTSLTWQPQWPPKPDVLFEGGNAAKDALGAVEMQSLSLLTANSKPEKRLLTTANATSAASALAARMAAQLMAEYPALWPETIRALIVHSAEWTGAMQQAFLPNVNRPTKNDSDWVFGKQNRHKGSLHSDIWRGSAVDLASRGMIGVYPALGWWKTRPRLERYGGTARYALVVSIHAPEVEVELYSAIANRIAAPVAVAAG